MRRARNRMRCSTESWRPAGAAAMLGLGLLGCTARTEPPPVEEAFIARRSVTIRADLPTSSPVVATVKLGSRVEVVGRRRRLVRVRTAGDSEGWARDDELISREVRDLMEQSRAQTTSYPSQGVVRAFDRLNVHLQAGLESPPIYQLEKDEGAELLLRRIVERTPGEAAEQGAAVVSDGWCLVRLPTGNVGWLLARRVYSGIPDEIAQYAEGRRIVSYASLEEVEDERRDLVKPTWLWTQVGKGKQTYDFDRFRVFRWSDRRNAYQTIKLRTSLQGFLPVVVHPKLEVDEGTGPGFSLTLQRGDRRVVRTYVLLGQRVAEVSERPAPPPAPAIRLELVEPTLAPPPDLMNRLLSWWHGPS